MSVCLNASRDNLVACMSVYILLTQLLCMNIYNGVERRGSCHEHGQIATKKKKNRNTIISTGGSEQRSEMEDEEQV